MSCSKDAKYGLTSTGQSSAGTAIPKAVVVHNIVAAEVCYARGLRLTNQRVF